MTDLAESISAVRRELRERIVPGSIDDLSERLFSLTLGLTQRIPVAFVDARMFRVRPMDDKPIFTHEIGAPPASMSSMQRLNEKGQSVLYLADSPTTAFAESRAGAGEFCLSEWRVTVQRLGMANGGIAPEMMAERFTKEIYEGAGPVPVPTLDDERIVDLFREIYTLDVKDDPLLYRWSIACARVNGFSHVCDLQATEKADGMTTWKGRYPFSAIAYPSVRMDRMSLNYGLNDRGLSHVRLNNLQWVRRAADGAYVGLDFANDWDSGGRILWTNRPARFQVKPGEGARLVKIAENEWSYETANGSVPWFS